MAKRWYILQVRSQYEKKVRINIEERVRAKSLDNFLEEIYVPIERCIEIRKGAKVESEKNLFPGYVLIKADLTDDMWQLIRNISGVGGFLGGKKPQPVPQVEIDRILKQVEEGIKSPRNKVEYVIGDEVKIIEGPFESFVGNVEKVDDENGTLKVLVSVLGRTTPVELQFGQVEKN